MKTACLKELVVNCYCSYGDDLGCHSNEYAVVKVSNIDGEGNFKNVFEKRSFEDNKIKKLLAVEGDLLVVKSSGSKAKILSGKTALVDKKLSGIIVSSNFLLRLAPKKEKVIPKYLWYLLNSEYSRNFIKTIVGTTTYPNLKWDLYSNHPVPLVDIQQQKEIVQRLDTADSLRQKRKKQIKLLDDYLKSVFLDMFGDPVRNEKGWAQLSLGDVSSDLKYGTNVKCFRRSQMHSIPVLRIPNISKGDIDLTDLKYGDLDEKEFNKLLLRKNDLLFVRTNGNPDYIGRCAVFNLEGNYVNASYLIRVRLKEKAKLKPSFICFVVSLPSYRTKITKESRTTAGNYNINTQGLKSLRIIQPSIELQNKFANIVEQTEQTKQKMRASLDEMDNHFNALMQKYFG
jgi:type I restriction enzyme S subunit